jgi:hypothetical protein
VTVDTTKLVPRLGVAYDITGDGRTTALATYGHYSGKYGEGQYAQNTDVGNPSRVTYGYTARAGQGLDFAPGFDLRSYTQIISASFPRDIFVADGVQSPTVHDSRSVSAMSLARTARKATYR